MHDKKVIKNSAIDSKVPSPSGLVCKTYIIQINKIFKNIENISKKILNSNSLVKKLIMTETLKKLITKYVLLLV